VPELSTLKLEIVPSPETNDHEVKIWADETELLSLASAMGLDPDDLFHQPQTLATSGVALVGRCDCGCLGCGDINARIEHHDSTVTWSVDGAPQIHFARDAYLRELERARADTTWETPERTAARLVRAALPSFQLQLTERGLSFDWASGRGDAAHFVVSLRSAKGQVMVRIANDGDPPRRLAERMLEMLRSGTF